MSSKEAKEKRTDFRAVLLGYIVCLGALLYYIGLSERLDMRHERALLGLRGRRVPQSVTVVRVDDRSFDKLGVPSTVDSELQMLAHAIPKISAAGAKLIVLDFLLSAEAKAPEVTEELKNAIASAPVTIAGAYERYLDTKLDGTQAQSIGHELPDEVFRHAAKEVVLHQVSNVEGAVSRLSLGQETTMLEFEKAPYLKVLREFVSPDIKEPGYDDLINYYGPPYSIPDVPIFEDLVQGYFLNRSFEQLSGRGRTIGPETRRAAYRPLAAKRFRAKREKSRAAPDLRKLTTRSVRSFGRAPGISTWPRELVRMEWCSSRRLPS